MYGAAAVAAEYGDAYVDVADGCVAVRDAVYVAVLDVCVAVIVDEVDIAAHADVYDTAYC